MGKSWKEKPWKYKNNKDFQKKTHKKNKKHLPPISVDEAIQMPWDDGVNDSTLAGPPDSSE